MTSGNKNVVDKAVGFIGGWQYEYLLPWTNTNSDRTYFVRLPGFCTVSAWGKTT